MRSPNSLSKGGSSKPGKSRWNFTQKTLRALGSSDGAKVKPLEQPIDDSPRTKVYVYVLRIPQWRPGSRPELGKKRLRGANGGSRDKRKVSSEWPRPFPSAAGRISDNGGWFRACSNP